MKPTSHFLGLSIKHEIFIDLFNSLEKYLKKNHLKKDVELQNLLSLHITLYYFDKKINVSNLEKIKEDLLNLNKKENLFSLYIDGFNFLERNNNKFLGYLYPSKNKNLEKIHLELIQHYMNEVSDNDYPKYIPHISIFKIRNTQQYQKHNNNLMLIINKHLKVIKMVDVFKTFNLYSVDSNYFPERQKVIL